MGQYVLLPGDPGRVPLIAKHLDGEREVAYFREFRTFTGTLEGVAVSVTSTGIGGPSCAIAVEELAQLGAHTFIRVGTSGALQPDIGVGEVVIATGAVRDEGTSSDYVPLGYPAVADHQVVTAMVAAARDLGVEYRAGVVQSKDSYYGQHEPERMPASYSLLQRYSAWERAGVLCSEMESSVLFVLAGILGLRAGSALAIGGNQHSTEVLSAADLAERRVRGVENAAACAVGAIRRLLQRGPDGP